MHDLTGLTTYERMVNQTPLAPMTLRIGVAGHRTLPPNQLPRLRAEIAAVYADIEQIVRSIAADAADIPFYADDAPVIRITSSLAEGADRLCVEPALIPFEHELAAILPFPASEFARDFSPGNSVENPAQGTVAAFYALLQRVGYYCRKGHGCYNRHARIIELNGDRANRDAAYNACSRLLVEHSDVLIAVYNGDNSTDSGTAATVKAAMQKGIPVVHIDTGCELRYRVNPGRQAGDSLESQDDARMTLQQELTRILLFSDRLDGLEANVRQEVLERFNSYRSDRKLCAIVNEPPDFNQAGPLALKKQYKNFTARAFDTLTGWLTNAKAIAAARQKQQPQCMPATGETHEAPPAPAARSRDRYYAAFLYADRLANYFSRTHRSTFVLIYLFGAAALIAAALALALKAFHWVEAGFGLVLLELVLLIVILLLYRQDRHQQKYHKRWLEYRHLAEALRPLYFFALTGRTFTPPSGASQAGQLWQTLYIETLHRWAGFSRVLSDAASIRQVQHFTTAVWLKGQIDYHSKNAAVMGILAEKLEHWNHGLFFVTLVFVVMKLLTAILAWVMPPADYPLHDLMNLLAYPLALGVIVLPILATAAYAIRNHAEFDISAQRSLAMRAALIQVYQDLNQQTLTATQLTEEMRRIAAITLQENSAWLDIFKVKQSEI